MTTKNLFDSIETLDAAARIPALRAVTHSAMAKCIGAIRQHMRDQERTQRDEESDQTALDQRNGHDEDERSVEEVSRAMGFGRDMPPLKQAAILHAVYDWANVQLQTSITSKWDAPLDLDGMLTFMTTKAQPLDKALVKALADAAKCPEATIVQLHELQEMRDRERLIEMLPTIKLTFNGFGDSHDGDCADELPTIAQHQLGVKVVESLGKAKDQVLMRVMRTRRITDLASIPLLEEGVKVMSDWVEAFEKMHAAEIAEAIEIGRAVRTLDDVKA